ncbi:MAG TPA: FAD-dependent oxidoreductase [Acidiferrobacteraceae bacterium]|nr:FAD-dependent oxidoreductase [Acidiferrobacteraceae bacterium]
MTSEHFDVVIIGGGISGTALLFALSRYTNIERICLIEKEPELAVINSHGCNNSQTLHCGDIETNYTLEKALEIKASANMLVNYMLRQGGDQTLIHRYPKMVLAVGESECQALRDRHKLFARHFPYMDLLDANAIGRIEPMVVRGRKDEIVAIGTENEYTAVNFNLMAKSFVDAAQELPNKTIDIRLATAVQSIEPQQDGFRLDCSSGQIEATSVVVCAGAHSLLFAQRMGYGLDYSCLPVAGSFYYTPQVLKGKVYTIQDDKLPFAAIHGDPDLLELGKTRFGPTALILPQLERYRLSSVPDFLRVFKPDLRVAQVFWDLFKDKDIRRYMGKNLLFEIPGIRRHIFLRDARKIVPDLKLSDLSFAKRIGGIRPVMIDKPNRKLLLGEAKINPGNGIIFNMTPSPGATSCLANAIKDLQIVTDHGGHRVYQDQLKNELITPQQPTKSTAQP